MASYAARFHIHGQNKIPLDIEVDVSDEKMTLLVGDQEVAYWPLQELEVGVWSDGFHVKSEVEEFVLNVTDAARFAVELGVDQDSQIRTTETKSLPSLMTRMVDELFARANMWLVENPKRHSKAKVWEAAKAIVTAVTYDELGEAIREILIAAKTDDRDAKDVVTAFGRLHPPQSLSNPEHQRSLVANYLVLRLEETSEFEQRAG